MDEQRARKYERLGKFPSKVKEEHNCGGRGRIYLLKYGEK